MKESGRKSDTEGQRHTERKIDLKCYSSGFEDGRGPETKEYRQFLEARKDKEIEPPEEISPC